jgi:hypothetical protein
MTRSDRWRALLRRLRIGGEARWIPDPDEREAHRVTVRRRLTRATTTHPAADPEETRAPGEP